MEHLLTLITGATSKAGTAIALHLARTRRLLLADQDAEELERLRRSCVPSAPHLIWAQELSEVESLEAALGAKLKFEDALIQNLVHCAVTEPGSDPEPLDCLQFESALRRDVHCGIELCRLVASRRFNQEALGTVVFVAGVEAHSARRGDTERAVGSGALESLTRALAVEWAPRIKVNCLLLGLGGPREKVPASDPGGAVAFLLSQASTGITGQTIVMDGGRSIS
ncbi:SDR family oxidoreductase [Geothrix paludis]|uniref:SDR family oxidoreductase n=1 Tax=Geothrix paludis TaxID=2922722 RepID=UPI001FAC51DA|nr:SDR family oxidoreductase [Geothrix paludis]